ncbi:hypothetical protein QO202_22075 [Aeromonas caviae]|uniref:hypothetical protein n=1 Tax=Aeromonas caviae TaxID=648 RepID=UPI002648163D|nr:hypothetical protein [Aeromonas caviae]MDN6870677.1 hypothetical protein [Aeromonas caviae]
MSAKQMGKAMPSTSGPYGKKRRKADGDKEENCCRFLWLSKVFANSIETISFSLPMAINATGKKINSGFNNIETNKVVHTFHSMQP